MQLKLQMLYQFAPSDWQVSLNLASISFRYSACTDSLQHLSGLAEHESGIFRVTAGTLGTQTNNPKFDKLRYEPCANTIVLTEDAKLWKPCRMLIV